MDVREVQVKCVAQWLVEWGFRKWKCKGKTECQFLLGSISGMRIELRVSHGNGASTFAYSRSPQGPHAHALSLWPHHTITPARSDFYSFLLETPRVGRSLTDEGAQARSPEQEFLHSLPPGSPLENHFLIGNLRDPQAAWVTLFIFPCSWKINALSPLRKSIWGWNGIFVSPSLLQYSILLLFFFFLSKIYFLI